MKENKDGIKNITDKKTKKTNEKQNNISAKGDKKQQHKR
jgi:hypothetical protein